MKSLLNFFRRVFTSRTAYLFFFAHWILFAVAIYQRGGIERELHPYYEPLSVNILIFLDLPEVFLADIVSSLVARLGGVEWLTYIICFFPVSLQWLLIGYGIEKLVKYQQNRIRK